MQYNSQGVLIPYITVEGEKAMTRLRFYGTWDRRKMRKHVRKNMATVGIKFPGSDGKRVLDFMIEKGRYDIGVQAPKVERGQHRKSLNTAHAGDALCNL
jgi:hypothetical protein